MLKIRFQKQFKKDYKRALRHSGNTEEQFKNVLTVNYLTSRFPTAKS